MAKIELSESWASDSLSDANEARESGLAKRQRILSKQTVLNQSTSADIELTEKNLLYEEMNQDIYDILL